MITLKMTPDDYYDPATDEYVLFAGTSVTCLQTDVIPISGSCLQYWESSL